MSELSDQQTQEKIPERQPKENDKVKEPENAKEIKTFTYTFVVFAVFLIIIGIITLSVSFNIDQSITNNQKDCTSKELRNANIGVMITSTIIICFSVSYIGCVTRCDCKQLKNISKYATGNPILFSISLIILGLVLIIFGTIISTNSKECSDVKSNSKYIWGMGTFVLLLGIVMITMSMLKNRKKSSP